MLVAIALSFILTFISLPVMIKVAEVNRLFVPNNYRKTHQGKISALGGVSIFLSSIISFLLFSDIVHYPDYRYMLSSALVLASLGFYDDLHEVKPIFKFIVQLLAVSILVFSGGVQIEFIQHHVAAPYGAHADQFISIFLMIWIINAFNLIDGVDLLASVVGFVVLATLGIWFCLAQQFDYSLILFTLASSLLAFMHYNFPPARIFMGDTGTMSIGLIMAIALIQFDEVNYQVEGVFRMNSAPALAFSFVSFLMFDMLRVALRRLSQFKYPFHGDRSHIHHVLLDKGFSPKGISLIIGLLVLSQIVLSFWLDHYFKLGNIVLIFINLAMILGFYTLVFNLPLGSKKSL